MQLLPSTYPILCAAMNKVSDAKLASAVWNSGAMPSLSLFNFIKDSRPDYTSMTAEVKEFKEMSPSGQFVYSVNSTTFMSDEFYEWVKQNKILHLEIILDLAKLDDVTLGKYTQRHIDKINEYAKKYKLIEVKLICKTLKKFIILEIEKKFSNLFDGYILKGADGAGAVMDSLDGNTLLQDQLDILEQYPNCNLLVSGGIATKSDIDTFLNNGAYGVCIGTLFALTEESKVSRDTKISILGKQVQRFDDTKQNAIIFSNDVQEVDTNRTRGLVFGTRSPDKGHIFVGTAISQITEIKTVAALMKELTCGI